MPAPSTRALEIDLSFDVFSSYRPFRRGHGDPTMHLSANELWRATRTPEGPTTVRIVSCDGRVDIAAWGPGAAWVLDRGSDLVGAHDDPTRLVARDPVVRGLARRFDGMRIVATHALIEALVAAILEQKVTGYEARRAWRGIVYRFGERAPGPLRLMLPPGPKVLAAQPYWEFHRFGVPRRKAELIRAVCARAGRLEQAVALGPQEATRRLTAFPGIGPWTAAETVGRALGDPDAVPVGDFHLPNLVAWAFARRPRGDDALMVELLAPYEGQRGRVLRLLEAGHPHPPKFGPRMPLRSIAAI